MEGERKRKNSSVSPEAMNADKRCVFVCVWWRVKLRGWEGEKQLMVLRPRL